MCGLTGIVRFGQSLTRGDLAALQNMTDALVSRGPDAGALWHENAVGLGHRRLSILDLSPEGAQPKQSRNGRFVIAYNGEIYNFEILRNELEAEGLQFRSVGDTEVMLEAISHWGIEKSLPRFNGMFAFALWDKQLQELTLARDAVGIKPMFWARINGGLVFGSEIKALKKHAEFNVRIDQNALGDYFSRTYIAAPRTIYQDCFRLRPGEILRIGPDRQVRSSAYKPVNELSCDPSQLNGTALTDAFALEMDKAVKRHMRADVPVAAFLSGGNDSALIAALLAREGNFKTYSVGYEEKNYDESVRAQKIAQHLSLSHEIILIDHKATAKILEQVASFYDEPFADASALPTYMLSKHVSSYTKVALSGDGADELFSGYPRYAARAQEWEKFSIIPRMIRPLISSLIPEKPAGLAYNLTRLALSDPVRSLPHIKKMLSEPSVLTYFQHQNYIGMDHALWRNSSLMNISDYDAASFPVKQDCLRAILDYDQAIRLPEGMLTKVDRASMAASLEVRVPFLDKEIVAFSRALPSAALASAGGPSKKIIKDLLGRYLPSDIVNAPKTGFHIPMKMWLRQHFRDWAQDLLAGQDDPYVDLPAARRLWADYADHGRDDLFYGLWCVLMYRQWLRSNV